MIQINGNEAMQADGMSIADYLQSEGYVLSHIAVERNEVIVSKKDYADTRIQDGDVIEIVNLSSSKVKAVAYITVGGGDVAE